MSSSRKRKVLVFLALILLGAIAFGLHFYRTQTTWIDSEPYRRISEEPARTLVVVYSPTGNTLGAAREAARFFDADILEIGAPQYSLDIAGQRLAADDADTQITTTAIEHDAVDLSAYDLILLCSPTWWFRPAIPLWSFVENHSFEGNKVLLLMTGNSRLKEEYIQVFADLVRAQGGEYLDNVFIERGRIYWQKTPAEVEDEVRQALESRRGMWPASIGEGAFGR